MFRVFLLLCLLWLPGLAHASSVDVNTATERELVTLPGIGPARAQAIIEHREQHGPFRTVDELQRVSGIGPATLEGLRDRVTVGEGTIVPAAPATTEAEAPAVEGAAVEAAAATPPARPASGPVVDINSATASQLQSLPGIGPAKARAILEDRDERGPFRSCDDLTRVVGIGPATVSGLADRCAAGQ